MQCWQTDHFDIMLKLALPMLLLYVIGIPGMLFFILRSKKAYAEVLITRNIIHYTSTNQVILTEEKSIEEDQSNWRKVHASELNEDDIDAFNREFSFTFCGYEKEYFWWEVVIIIRKVLISLIGTLLARDALGQSVLVMVVLFVSVVAHVHARPFIEPWADELEFVSLCSTLTLFIMGTLTIGESSLAG